MHDYPAFISSMADAYESASTDLFVREKAGVTGFTQWAESYDNEQNNPVLDGEDRVMSKMLSDLPKETVLDVGAGTGRHSIPLARSGSRVTAVEPNEEMLRRAKEKASDEHLKIESFSNDVFHPLNDDRVFDLVLCCLVLSHVERIDVAISSLCTRVKHAGHLVITDFHPFNLLVGMRTSYTHRDEKFTVPNYIHLPSRYIHLVMKEGFRIVEFHESGEVKGYTGLPATLVLCAQKR
jgi:2-polyprenyl-3-methyl-5-hydroxy-6-metoxy-1,4-benzoquinol methylase